MLERVYNSVKKEDEGEGVYLNAEIQANVGEVPGMFPAGLEVK
jgi:hypothetical protein